MLFSKRIAMSVPFAAALALIAGCQSKTATTENQPTPVNAETEANVAAFRRLNDAFATADTTVVDSVLADSINDHAMMPPGIPNTKEGLKQLMVAMHQGFPDSKFDILQITGDGDKVWAYSVMTGTNTGPFMGMKPTGKQVRVENFDLVRFANGKAVEHWGVVDNATMMQQLGTMGGDHAMGGSMGGKKTK